MKYEWELAILNSLFAFYVAPMIFKQFSFKCFTNTVLEYFEEYLLNMPCFIVMESESCHNTTIYLL